MDKDTFSLAAFMGVAIPIGLIVLFGCGLLADYFIFAKINVWKQSVKGQAELAHAEYNRKILICEAEAKMESSKHQAEAEIIRARGVAQANEIIGCSLRNNEAYLRYLWIQGLQTNQMQTVYIPTEAGLPILEANRLNEYHRHEHKSRANN